MHRTYNFQGLNDPIGRAGLRKLLANISENYKIVKAQNIFLLLLRIKLVKRRLLAEIITKIETH